MTCLKNQMPVIHFMNNNKSDGIDVIVYGDLWGCEKCKCEVVLGFGSQRFGMDISEKETDYLLSHRYVEIKK